MNRRKDLLYTDQLTPMKIGILTNITVEYCFTGFLTESFESIGYEPKVSYIPWEEKEEWCKYPNLDLLLVWLDYILLFPEMNHRVLEHMERAVIEDYKQYCHQIHQEIQARFDLRILWVEFCRYSDPLFLSMGNAASVLAVDDALNLFLRNKEENTVFLDLRRLIAGIGMKQSYDLKNFYRWNCLYSPSLIREVASEAAKQYLIMKGKTPKCIVTDCDNVLWGGILSEDGIENVKLGGIGAGKLYKDFQNHLVTLYHLGIILAVSSKNDKDDVFNMFEHHSEMVLKKEHISCFEVNWGDKYNSIQNIADTLNLGLDSIVFIDDSELELSAVRHMLPEVQTVLFTQQDPFAAWRLFSLPANIEPETVKKRQLTYQANVHRKQKLDQSTSYGEFIKSLETKTRICLADTYAYQRISELSQRTNQCTLGRRYSVEELQKMVSFPGYHLYSVSISDKFGDLGLVGAIGIYDQKLDLFCLSCRALGRDAEANMLRFAYERGARRYVAEETPRNQKFLRMLKEEFSHGEMLKNNRGIEDEDDFTDE